MMSCPRSSKGDTQVTCMAGRQQAKVGQGIFTFPPQFRESIPCLLSSTSSAALQPCQSSALCKALLEENISDCGAPNKQSCASM